MSNIAIRVENLGKRYRIGARQKQLTSLRESLVSLATSPFAYLRSALRGPSEEETLWALRDVSFEVKRGEVMGIIGRNGAGKSTLLKILSRITEPTTGRAEVYGRVGSLLEVGTGFHPELTGRENIYLNGAILGMTRLEIERKFDEIVEFAEVERFMDTPVKRYSSGMYVRLGFAVAAHLEPEILIVDEVLAVGDIAFQKKCLGKMRNVAGEGRTVLFVSHNMSAVRQLCHKCVLLSGGKLEMTSDSWTVTAAYENAVRGDSTKKGVAERTLPVEASWFIQRAELVSESGSPLTQIKFGDMIRLIVHLAGSLNFSSYNMDWVIRNEFGEPVTHGSSGPMCGVDLTKDDREVECVIGPLSLASGSYDIDLTLTVTALCQLDSWQSALSFDVVSCDPFGLGFDLPTSYRLGSVVTPLRWVIRR